MSMSNEAWDNMIETNLSGVFYAMRSEITAMLRNERNNDGSTGSIVNISSVAGVRGSSGASHYCATKWGVCSSLLSPKRYTKF
jgi:NAD(P)-dependent dehydrogenase (short-subunit alcohol dehydrogenase family)